MSMCWRAFLLCGLLTWSVLSIRSFDSTSLPKDNPIGRIFHLRFPGNDQMFFVTEAGLMGFMDEKMGVLQKVFQLQEDEKMVDYLGFKEVVLTSGKDLNIFMPFEQRYIELTYSEFLAKQQFKEVKIFRHYFEYDYVMTDNFLMRSQKYTTDDSQQLANKDVIIARRLEGQQLLQLTFINPQNPKQMIVGLIVENAAGDVCLLKYSKPEVLIERLCYVAQVKSKVKKVFPMRNTFMVIYDSKKVLLNDKMEKIADVKDKERVTNVGEVKIWKDPNGEMSLTADSEGKTVFFPNINGINGANNLEVFDKYIQVRKDAVILVTIQKQIHQKVNRAWAETQKQSKEVVLVIQFEDGTIKGFRISEEKKEVKEIWNSHLGKYRKIEGGKVIKLEEVGQKEEEKIIEEGEKEAEEEKTERKAQERQQADLGEQKPQN